MTLRKPINVLFIDDDSNVRDALITEARREQILIKGVDNLDDGLKILRESDRIKFVILDAKAYQRPGQVKGTESTSFVYKAIEALPRLGSELNRHIPYCFFTGFSDIANDLRGADHIVIDKNEENATKKLFEFIWETYKDSKEGYLRQKYATQFDAIDLLNSTQAEQDLIALLFEKEGTTREVNFIQASRHIRPIMEAVFAKVAQIDKSLVPTGLQQGDQQSLRKAISFVAGQPQWKKDKYILNSQSYMPLHLWLTITALQDATSTAAMHNYEHPISRHTLDTFADILADLLGWFSDFYKKHS